MSIWGAWELKKLAFRNIFRHKVKTLLTSLAVTVCVAMFIFLNCWVGGASIESRRNIVQYETGAAKLQTNIYFEKKDEMPSYENFTGWEAYSKALAGEGYNSAPRFVFSGTLLREGSGIPVLFHGIDPALEKQTMHYTNYIEYGRFVQNGNFEIILGIMAADRLKIGIPSRPIRHELEELITQVAHNPADADFILSLYAQAEKRGYWDYQDLSSEQLVLKKDIPKADLERFWDLVMASGRNDLRISTVIDKKEAPETIRADRFEVELMEALYPGDRELVQNAYEYEYLMNDYVLKAEIEDDEYQLALVRDVMIRAGFSGAVRNVFQVFDVKVVGIINSPAPLPNSNTAYIPLDVLQDEAGMMLKGAVTELVINDSRRASHQLPGESESSSAINSALERAMGSPLPHDLGIRTWLDYSADYLSFEKMENTMPNVLTSLLFILAFLGISNTILLSIMERTKETGMIRAMGMTDGQVKLVYMFEAGFIGLFGSILGIILGCIINYPMVKYGMDFSAMSEMMGEGGLGFRVINEYRSTWLWGVIFGSGVVATLMSFLIAWFPTRKALKLSITDSMRFE